MNSTFYQFINIKEGSYMSEQMECMCMECGISSYLTEKDIVIDVSANAQSKFLDNRIVCQNCGGPLRLVGRAEDEPFYRLE